MKRYLIIGLLFISSLLQAQEKSDYNYEYALIEAERQKMIGNLNEAIKLYMRCIEEKPESAVAHFELGSIYAAYEKDSLANIHLEKAWEYEPDNYWYVVAYSHSLDRNGQNRKALKVVKKFLRKDDDIRLYYNLAENYLELNKSKKALKILNEIEKENGLSEMIVLKKVEVFKKTGEHQKARQELNKLIEIFPESPDYYIILAEYLKETGAEEEAAENFIKAYKLDSANIYAITNLADYYNNQGNKSKGLYYLSRAFTLDQIPLEKKMNTILYFINDDKLLTSNTKEIERLVQVLEVKYPDNYNVKTVAYDFYNKTEQRRNAYNVIKELIDTKKDSYMLWQQLIYNASILGEYEELIKYGKEALTYFPNKSQINLYIGIAYYQTGKYQEALKTLGDSYRENYDLPVRIQYKLFIAESQYKLGDKDSAFILFDEILQMDPENVAVMNNYSYYLALENRDLEKAARLSYYTIQTEPENSVYQDTYGWIMFVSGNYEEAEKYISKAVINSGNDADVLFHYAEVLNRLGKKTDALYYYRKALEAGYDAEQISSILENMTKNE